MEEQEIELRDYINVVLKRKWIVITVFLVSVITAAVLSLLAPRVYEATAVVENGSIEGEVIKKADSRDIITSTEILDKALKEAKVDMPIYNFRKKIEVKDIKGTSYLKLIVYAESADRAKQMCGALANAYLAYGNKLYSEREDLIKENLARLSEEAEGVKGDITQLEDTILEFSLPQTTVSPETMSKIILLRNILSGSREHLIGLNNQENNVRTLLVKAREFKIIDAPTAPESPVKPKKKRTVAVAGAVGLILGIFLAFFIEYWKR